MIGLIADLLLKNRTIISSDMADCITTISGQIPMTIHRYPSGSDHGTWTVPPRWDVRRAVLSGENGAIASYEDHPLFVAPYSRSFTGWLPREELLTHVRSVPEVPDGFVYEHRLAYDHRRRLKDWMLSLPHRLVEGLTEERYHVDLQVDVGPGEMLVGESTIRGTDPGTFVILGHLCHTGQANDGLAGVAVGVEVMKRLRHDRPRPRGTYQLLILPETIGSAVHLAANEDVIDGYLGGVFVEMPGTGERIRLGHTRRGNTYIDRLFVSVLRARKLDFVECEFTKQWGNDELIFDSPGVGVPTVALERHPFRYYHTSRDDLDATSVSSLNEVVDVLMGVIEIMEDDFIPRPLQRVPVYLTRYDLYADWTHENETHQRNEAIIHLMWSGRSVFDISSEIGVPFGAVRSYVQRFADAGLVEKLPVTPAYTRDGPRSHDHR